MKNATELLVSVATLSACIMTNSPVFAQPVSHRLFDATPVVGSGEQTPIEQAEVFQSLPQAIPFASGQTAVISSTPDGGGPIVVDNFLRINGQNACEGVPGQRYFDACFGEFLDEEFLFPNLMTRDSVGIENVLGAIPRIDVTRFIPTTTPTPTSLFELVDFGIIKGSTDLFLVVNPEVEPYLFHNGTVNPSLETTDFTQGAAASTAVAVGDFMFVGDDDDNILRRYNRTRSGSPTDSLDLTASLAVGGQVDIEASTHVGDRIFWLGSHSHSRMGNPAPDRQRLFVTNISGDPENPTLTVPSNGYYRLLRKDLQNLGSGPVASAIAKAAEAARVPPEASDGSGFNIEGLARAPNGLSYYIGFRAPLVPVDTRSHAAIVPLINLEQLVTGEPSQRPNPIFEDPIALDLGGRGIRSIECNTNGCLILAGPPDDAIGPPPKDFRLYTWSGNPNDTPQLRTANFAAFSPALNPEGIVALPEGPLTADSRIQLVNDDESTPPGTRFRTVTVVLGLER